MASPTSIEFIGLLLLLLLLLPFTTTHPHIIL